MKRKSTRKPSAADLLSSPMPTANPNRSTSESPKQFEFNLNAFNNTTSTSKKTKKKIQIKSTNCAPPASSALNQSNASPSAQKNLSTISDLKDLASSRLESIKRLLDRSHSEIVKDVEASHFRLHKRFKIQSQACQQTMDEAEKEYKKMSERIAQSQETMKDSYQEFLAEVQAGVSRACKTSIPELAQKFEKALGTLRSRYGVSSTGKS